MLDRVLRDIDEAISPNYLICTGDLGPAVLPPNRMEPSVETRAQYIAKTSAVMRRIREWGWHRNFLWVPGNHDDWTLIPASNLVGVNIHNRLVRLASSEVSVFGWGGAPQLFGWPMEWTPAQIGEVVVDGSVNLLVTHAPPKQTAGAFAVGGEDCGVPRIRDWINGRARWSEAGPGLLHVHGHIHEGAGKITYGTGWVSGNAGAFGPPYPRAGYLVAETDSPNVLSGAWALKYVEVSGE